MRDRRAERRQRDARDGLEAALAWLNAARAAAGRERLDAMSAALDACRRSAGGMEAGRLLDRIAAALVRAREGRDAAAVPLLDELFDGLFDFPSRRLAVYGTLAPGERHHGLVSDIPGAWSEGTVEGAVAVVEGYPVLRWRKGAGRVPVKVLASERLPEHWRRLDRFEGPTYRRILVPVRQGAGQLVVANIYEARPPEGGPARL